MTPLIHLSALKTKYPPDIQYDLDQAFALGHECAAGTPAEIERLALLAEECGEVVQMVGKILRHGYNSKHPDTGEMNRTLLENEIGDLFAAIELMLKAEDLYKPSIIDAAAAKLAKVDQWLHHQGKQP